MSVLKPLQIDIVSDVVCPWCYIGKRQLEAALALYAQQNPEAERPTIVWRPFQLNPQLPPEGMSRQDYVVQKFGAARSKARTVGRRASAVRVAAKIVRCTEPSAIARTVTPG